MLFMSIFRKYVVFSIIIILLPHNKYENKIFQSYILKNKKIVHETNFEKMEKSCVG